MGCICFLRKILWLGDFSIRHDLNLCFELWEIRFLDIGNIFSSRIDAYYMWGMFIMAFLLILNAKNSSELEFKPTKTRCVFTVLMLFWSIISLAGVSEFLYFGF